MPFWPKKGKHFRVIGSTGSKFPALGSIVPFYPPPPLTQTIREAPPPPVTYMHLTQVDRQILTSMIAIRSNRNLQIGTFPASAA